MALHEPGHFDHVHVMLAGDNRSLAERFDAGQKETLFTDCAIRHALLVGW
jgi:hypothetical protein